MSSENNRPTDNEEDYITVWEAPKIEAPEFRLYYNKDGSVKCYTCEQLEGDHIVIDAGVFAEARPDIKVIDGVISRNRPSAVVQKYKPSTSGILASIDDISILVTDKSKGKYWELFSEEIE